MKILIRKGSLLFDRLYDLHVLIKIANEAAEEIVEKHGAIAYKRSVNNIAGGIIGMKFEKRPDRKTYRISPFTNTLYIPRTVEAKKEIAELPVVTCKDLNNLIGFKSGYYSETLITHPGVLICEDFALLSIPDEPAFHFILQEGMEEINFSQYKEFVNLIKEM